MLDLTAITYTLAFADGTELGEPAVHERGGFAAVCAGRDDIASLTLHTNEIWLLRVALRPGLRPIFGRLWVHTFGPDGQQIGERWLRAICAGWQQTVETRTGPRNVKTLYWLTRDGIYLADRDLDEITS
jgi:hypothetical protein